MNRAEATARLATILQLAHSGELGAVRAYGGHARSVRDPVQRQQIRTIGEQEFEHRVLVREMLDELGIVPSRMRETVLFLIGTTIALLCRLGGWFVPMYGAGRLESRNIKEYEDAARFAVDAGYDHFVDDLLRMAEVEWDHERYFREIIEGHALRRWLPRWTVPPPREAIRDSFEQWTRTRPGAQQSATNDAVREVRTA